MYDYISGSLAELTPAFAVLEAGGIGYHINISLQTFSAVEGEANAKLFVHLYYVRDDLPVFYGFATREEREVFRMLVSVSGVGGNTARMILSTYSPQELTGIISSENATLLKNVKGLGLKTAQKIIVELKDKILGVAGASASGSASMAASAGGTYEEALSALTMLGFQKGASDKVLRAIIKDNPLAGVEEVIRLSLKKL